MGVLNASNLQIIAFINVQHRTFNFVTFRVLYWGRQVTPKWRNLCGNKGCERDFIHCIGNKYCFSKKRPQVV